MVPWPPWPLVQTNNNILHCLLVLTMHIHGGMSHTQSTSPPPPLGHSMPFGASLDLLGKSGWSLQVLVLVLNLTEVHLVPFFEIDNQHKALDYLVTVTSALGVIH